MYEYTKDFFYNLTLLEPIKISFIADIFIKMKQYNKALIFIAKFLKQNPHIIILLYKQAECFIQIKKYEQAITLLKICI